jgi:hypothetical protein
VIGTRLGDTIREFWVTCWPVAISPTRSVSWPEVSNLQLSHGLATTDLEPTLAEIV